MAKKSHAEVEFTVDDAGGRERSFDTFDEASGFAVGLAASRGRAVAINVLIFGERGAEWWGGDDGLEEYLDDPDASVSERIEVTADAQGRIA